MRSDRQRLNDAIAAIDVVVDYLPADRTVFDQDPPLQSRILRHIMIVGEALWRISKEVKQAHPSVPWRQIEGMRHILVHDYFVVDWDVVYRTAQVHMPPLRAQPKAILANLPD